LQFNDVPVVAEERGWFEVLQFNDVLGRYAGWR
jgi:hypothetical protein